ncbi:MAG: hypothetical protein HONDAALG_03257 [Gammaproteobacteria bacterium]|nr:hypothetical protein [Gammaproteobacteria bacterium]
MWPLKDEEMAAPPAAGDGASARDHRRAVLQRHPQVATGTGDAPR